jgi:hypothetical protein
MTMTVRSRLEGGYRYPDDVKQRAAELWDSGIRSYRDMRKQFFADCDAGLMAVENVPTNGTVIRGWLISSGGGSHLVSQASKPVPVRLLDWITAPDLSAERLPSYRIPDAFVRAP